MKSTAQLTCNIDSYQLVSERENTHTHKQQETHQRNGRIDQPRHSRGVWKEQAALENATNDFRVPTTHQGKHYEDNQTTLRTRKKEKRDT